MYIKRGKYIIGTKCKGLWWLRICGYGVHYKNTRHHPLVYSERHAKTKMLKIRNHVFKILMKGK